MKSISHKRVLRVLLCAVLCLFITAGCMRRTQDETSWVTNWEEEHVPAEGSRGDKTPVPSRVPGNGSSSGAGTSTSVGGLTGVDG